MLPPPRAARSAVPADWIRERYTSDGHWATKRVGTGFEAYARIFHPHGDGEEAQTWAQIAAQHGKAMHPSARWDEITADGPWDPDAICGADVRDRLELVGDLPATAATTTRAPRRWRSQRTRRGPVRSTSDRSTSSSG